MTITVYPDFDNEFSLLLKSDGAAYDLSDITKMELAVGSRVIESTNLVTDPIQWDKAGYAVGEVRFFLGALTTPISMGAQRGYLTVYDLINDDGLVWGSFSFRCISVPKPVAAP